MPVLRWEMTLAKGTLNDEDKAAFLAAASASGALRPLFWACIACVLFFATIPPLWMSPLALFVMRLLHTMWCAPIADECMVTH